MSFEEKKPVEPAFKVQDNYGYSESQSDDRSVVQVNSTRRTLHSRHINLIAIGGSIGTGLFITIGSGGLVKAGPLGLFLAYLVWTSVILMLTVSVGEMVCYLPLDSPFLTMAGRVVDPAFEAAASINFWLMESLYIPFEIGCQWNDPFLER